jgi:hypothetical protein
MALIQDILNLIYFLMNQRISGNAELRIEHMSQPMSYIALEQLSMLITLVFPIPVLPNPLIHPSLSEILYVSIEIAIASILPFT